MATVTINRGEAPVTGITLDLTPREAEVVQMILLAGGASNARLRSENTCIYGVLSALGSALLEARLAVTA